MKKNIRVTVGCLAALVVVLVLGLTLWWIPRPASDPTLQYQDELELQE